MSDSKLRYAKYFWVRNRVSILFPAFYFTAIYADWSHTQEYKQKKAFLANRLIEDLQQWDSADLTVFY